MNDFQAGAACQALGHYFETLKLRAYPDPYSPLGKALRTKGAALGSNLSGAPWTIGYGDTGPDVVEGLVITEADALERYAKRLSREFGPAVRTSVKVPLSQAQFDALVDLAYNI